MDQRIINLYDNFTHGGMNRRDFLDRLSKLAGSTAAAAALLPLLQNDYAKAAIVAADDARLAAERVSYDSPKGKINGYLARAKDKGKRPAVHRHPREPRPQSAHRGRRAPVCARRLPRLRRRPPVAGRRHAGERGRGARAASEDEPGRRGGRAGVGGVRSSRRTRNRPARSARSAFASAALMVNRLAASSAELDAGVAYYGAQVPAAQVPSIKAALMLHYAENDDGMNAGIAAYEAALKANNKRFTSTHYPGTQHAFNNDTGAARYNKAAADLAWQRTLAFFKEQLGAPPNAA